MLLLLSAAFAAGCADDKEEGGNDIKLNPDPTQLSNITLMKATFAADEFNMISEPGFELFPDEAIDYRSLWYFEGAYKEPSLVSKHTQTHGGQVALKLENPNDGSWCDACLQSIALKKGKDYTFSCFGQASWAGMNAFTASGWKAARSMTDRPAIGIPTYGPNSPRSSIPATIRRVMSFAEHGAIPEYGSHWTISDSFRPAPPRPRPNWVPA